MSKLPWWLTVPLGAAFALWLLRQESTRPLRRKTRPKLRRMIDNLLIAASAAATLQLVERPMIVPLSRLMMERQWGLARLPLALAVPLSVLWMDGTLYLWHVLTHKVPLLWRFHRVHHVDADLDASTALRFHFGEQAISTAFRAVQVCLLGVGPLALSVWQALLFLSILFHHSNLRLDPRLEERLGAVIITPRLHGIHHTATQADTDSNWSSGLALWDRLFGTLRRERGGSRIGLPESTAVPTLSEAFALPFSGLPVSEPR